MQNYITLFFRKPGKRKYAMKSCQVNCNVLLLIVIYLTLSLFLSHVESTRDLSKTMLSKEILMKFCVTTEKKVSIIIITNIIVLQIPMMMMIIRTTHYLVHAAHEAIRKFSVSMSFCRLLIPVVC